MYGNKSNNKYVRGGYDNKNRPKGKSDNKYKSDKKQVPSLQIFACPKCRRVYDIYSRYPLVLECTHTFCEQCIQLTLNRNEVKCFECHVPTIAENVQFESARDGFKVNYYLLGQLIYAKQHTNVKDISGLGFHQVGINEAEIVGNRLKIPVPKMVLDKCSVVSCFNESTLRCADCAKIYCEICSEKFHKSAIAPKSHRIYPLNISECAEHTGNPEEFYCYECKRNFCSYCVITYHNKHTNEQITKLKEEHKPKFESLLNGCHEMLKNLQITHKKVQDNINKCKAPNNKSADISISKFFFELHAKLQLLETDITKKCNINEHKDLTKLLKINSELTSNIQTINNLVYTGNQIISKNHNVRQNISVIMERMENATKLPCYLDGENSDSDTSNSRIECPNLFDNLEKHFHIKESKKYKLIYMNEFPDNYNNISSISDIDSSDTSSQCSGSNASFESNREIMRSTDASKSCTNFQRKQFAIDEKHNVIISHIVSPSSIFVQLHSDCKAIDIFHRNIELEVKRLTFKECTEPTIGDTYIVKCYDRVKPAWCRVTILSIQKDDAKKINVKLIDYGNEILVNLFELREITTDFKQMPKMAYECRLYNLHPFEGEWKSEVANLIGDIITKCDILMIVLNASNPILDVEIIAYPEGNACSIRDSLIFIGYGKPYDTDLRNRKLKENCIPIKFFNQSHHFLLNETFQVIISHIIDPYNIFVQYANFQDNIKKLERNMNEHYDQRSKSNVYTPEIEMVVAVKIVTPTGANWMRAIVTDFTDGEGMITVFLVDYGNTLTVSWNQVKKLNEKFISLECQAFLIKLSGIAPHNSSWDESSNVILNKHKLKTILKIMITNTTKIVEVNLLECFSEVNISINAEMVKMGLAKSTGESSKVMEWPQIEKEVKRITVEDNFTLDLLKTVQGTEQSDSDDEDLDESEGYELVYVSVLFVENPGCIYVHFPNETKLMDQLKDLHLSLQEYCVSYHLNRKTEWDANDIAIIMHPVNGQYYRAMVRKSLGNGKYQVFTRDYAEELVVMVNDMGITPDEFLSLPLYAYRCHLDGITASNNVWTLTARDFLRETFSKDAKNVLITRTGPMNAEKFSQPAIFWHRDFKAGSALERSKFKTSNINKKIVRYGLAIVDKKWVPPPKKIMQIAAKPVNKSKQTARMNFLQTNPFDWMALMDDGFNCEGSWKIAAKFDKNEFAAIASYVDENAVIYLHEIQYVTLLEEIEAKMLLFFQDTPPESIETPWKCNEICSVRYKENQKWYRGSIKEINENQIKVIMIDYGNVEDVDLNDLRKHVLFLDIPAMAKKIKLHNVYAKSGKFNTGELDMLHKLIVEREISVKIYKRKPPLHLQSATVYIDNINVNAFMVKNSENCVPKLGKTVANKSKDADVIIESESIELIRPIMEEVVNTVKTVVNLSYNRPDLPKDKFFNVTIINVIEHDKVVFELIQPKLFVDADFAGLLADIGNNALQQAELDVVEVGVPCIALYAVDGIWYRGLVYNINPLNDELTVLFVDFGNVECIKRCDVRVSAERWMEPPVEQYVAVIAGVRLLDGDNPLLAALIEAHMSEYCNDTKKLEIVKYKPLTIKLYDVDTNVLSYQALIDQNIFTL